MHISAGQVPPIAADHAPVAAPDADLARLAFDHNPLGLAVVERAPDGCHTIVQVNRVLDELCAVGAGSLSGRTVEHLLVDGDLPFVDGRWHDRQCWDGDGLPIWTRWQVAPMPSAGGTARRLLVQVERSTDRARAERQAQQEARQHARLLELIPEPVIVRRLDGTILYWNGGATQVYGIPREQAIGRRTHEVLATGFGDASLVELEDRLAKDGTWDGRLEHRHADGRVLTVASKHILDDDADGRPVILEINIDITDQIIAEQALAASEAKFRSQFASTSVGQVIRGVDGRIEDSNPALAALLGRKPQDLIGRVLHDVLDPRVDGEPFNALSAMLDEGVDVVRRDGTLTRADGCRIEVEMSVSLVRAPDGSPVRVIGSFLDITARKIAEYALTHRALHDPLTGLPNRALLIDRVAVALNDEDRRPRTVGLVYLDLDGFKAVNDGFGHHTGDALLIEVAHRLQQCVRSGDTVARLGGDEFVILCPDLDVPDRLHDVAARALNELSRPYALAGARINSVTASIGISYPQPTSDVAQALREADRAMYLVKKSGKKGIGRAAANGRPTELLSAG